MRISATNGASQTSCTYVVGETTGCRLSTLSDGTWTLTAAVTDRAGNQAEAPASLAVVVAATPTVEPLVLTSSDDPSDGVMAVDVKGAASGRLVVVTASDGQRTITCSFIASPSVQGCTLVGVEPGRWSVVATPMDSSGNAGPTTEPLRFEFGGRYAPDGLGGGLFERSAGRTRPLDSEASVALLASMLALIALKRRRDSEPERLDNEDREESGVANYSAGSGSGGIDLRSDWYRPWSSDRLDFGIKQLAHKVHRISPMVGRSLDDGSYLRAIAGILWLALPLLGAVLGIIAALDTSFVVVLPSLWIVIALLVIGTLDAAAGLVAVATYGTAVLIGGGFESADSLRGYLGLAGLMFLIGLVASATRPYRRTSVDDHVWNRIVDFVLIPLFGAWAAGSIFKAIPHLSGLDVDWSNRVGTVEISALLILAVRFALENFARVTVASRLQLIENEHLPKPSETQKMGSRIIRAAVFAFVAVVFVGANWWLAGGVVMFLVPRLLEPFTDRLPRIRGHSRFVPRRLVRVVMMLIVMHWWSQLVLKLVDSNEVQWSFVLMSVPGLALGVVDWFARDDAKWPSNLVSRSLGIATLVIGVAIVRGWIL